MASSGQGIVTEIHSKPGSSLFRIGIQETIVSGIALVHCIGPLAFGTLFVVSLIVIFQKMRLDNDWPLFSFSFGFRA